MLPINQQAQGAPSIMPQAGQTPQVTPKPNGQAVPVGNMAQAPAPQPMTTNAPQISNANVAQAPQAIGMQTTAGGLQGNINPNRYQSQVGVNMPNQEGGQQGGNYRSQSRQYSYGNGGQQPMPSQPQSSVGNFDQYRDSALAQAMRDLDPRIEAQNSAFEQQMLNRGIQPDSEMYQTQKDQMLRGQNDLLSQAQYGAQQQGLQAQQQAYAQQYGYDALANALAQTQIGADASMYGANTSANASMANAQTGANASMYNAGLANQLGYAGLNEQARQADMNDIFRTQGQDINAALGWANHGLGQQGMDINAFNAQNNANNNWWNQIGGMTANAPGVMFNPTGNLAGHMQNAGQNMYNAQGAQNQALGNLAGGLFAMSDERLKENIELVDNIEGINVYEFDYIDKKHGKDRYRGVMAQEVQKRHPHAVFEANGYLAVNYDVLPVKMEVVK